MPRRRSSSPSKADAGQAAWVAGTARVPEVDGEHVGHESQIDVEKTTDLSEVD
jgi:hypothetical protein